MYCLGQTSEKNIFKQTNRIPTKLLLILLLLSKKLLK